MEERLSKRVAVVGDLGSIIGFRGMSMETFAVASPEEAVETMDRLVQSEAYAVIYVTEQVSDEAAEIIAELRFKPMPAIVTIPQAGEFQGLGKMVIQDAVKKAIGFNILGDWDKKHEHEEEIE